jgi:hypothetical protein
MTTTGVVKPVDPADRRAAIEAAYDEVAGSA